MKTTRILLLEALLERRSSFVSGEKLSQLLHISRTAVWKHIEELRKEGYVIDAVKKQGYKLLSVPETLLDSTLLPLLTTKWLGQALKVYDQVDSTQRVAHEWAEQGCPSGALVIANQQSAGRGRLGRRWFSPSHTGIWMSFVLRPSFTLREAPQLTLLTAVALAKSINKLLPVDVGIKWPNDVLINGKKIAGVLTELRAEMDQINHLVIGIGMNVNHREEDFPQDLAAIATSLKIEAKRDVDRHQVIMTILKEWEQLYEMYIEHGFGPIKVMWETYAVSIGQPIIARTGRNTYKGIATGITEEGVLLLQDSLGVVQRIYSADIETL